MKKESKHTEISVIRSLSKKNDLRIEGYMIKILNGFKQPRFNDLGNKSWGKIDFLVNFCGYRIQKVPSFNMN